MYFGKGLNMLEMALICGKQFKYVGSGFTMWEMA